MAGHSKFKNIMFRKGAQDKKRARRFAKLSREISVAVKMGGSDAGSNPRLRTAMLSARGENMPNDNITRAIAKAAGEGAEVLYEEIRYEGYALGGVAVMVEVLTDNRNRASAQVRSLFSKFGGSLGEPGTVAFLFKRCGEIRLKREKASEEALFEAALEVGAEEVVSETEEHSVMCDANDLHKITSHLQQTFGEITAAQLIWQPQSTTLVEDKHADTLTKMLEALEECEDVQQVWANFDMTEETLTRLSLQEEG